MGDPTVVKSGWLFRQSTVLRRWRHNWFVLYRDGTLKYFTSPNSTEVEDAILIKFAELRFGRDVTYTDPPKGYLTDALLRIKVYPDKLWIMCAESVDEMKAWEMSLAQLHNPAGTAVVRNVVGPVVTPMFSPMVTPMVTPMMTPMMTSHHVVAPMGGGTQVINYPTGQIVQTTQPALNYTVQDAAGNQTIVYQQGVSPYHHRRHRGIVGRRYYGYYG